MRSMRKLIVIFICLLSYSLMAKDKLTPKQFLKLVDKGKVQFQVDFATVNAIAKSYLMMLNNTKDFSTFNQQQIDLVIEKGIIPSFHRQYSFFKKEFLYARYVDDMPYRYSINFDFSISRKCKLRIERINPECGSPICSTKMTFNEMKTNPNVDLEGTVIDNKYCEKLYGVKLP